jgi:hypothetical protein
MCAIQALGAQNEFDSLSMSSRHVQNGPADHHNLQNEASHLVVLSMAAQQAQGCTAGMPLYRDLPS